MFNLNKAKTVLSIKLSICTCDIQIREVETLITVDLQNILVCSKDYVECRRSEMSAQCKNFRTFTSFFPFVLKTRTLAEREQETLVCPLALL